MSKVKEQIRHMLYNYYSEKVQWSKGEKKVEYSKRANEIWQDDKELLKEMEDWNKTNKKRFKKI